MAMNLTTFSATASPLESVLDDFTESWERGERPRAERYLGFLKAEDSASLIYHEYCLAEASDLAPDPADYLRRFPDHADQLGRLFALHGAFPSSMLRDWAGPEDLPSSGDEIGPYRLLRELGRGAFARVFLAEQVDLDHRLVVLKVSTRATAEPRLLARARHPHIVEVLRHATTDDGGLHLVCMPFLGGATLASVLEGRRASRRRPRSGRDLLADLDRASAPEYPKAELVRPAREVLARLSYPQAVAWMVARLAEALDHAHTRGVAHGDLKPSNVLITAEAAPLLLDMNLATDWRGIDNGDGASADLGGTLAYMAPERLLAIARGGEGASTGASDSHRADLYSLGLVLLEALTGEPPEVPEDRPRDPKELAGSLARLRQTLPGRLLGRGDGSIPPTLRSILARCLAPDPIGRYGRGNELAEDLDRWRSDRPLAFAEETRRSAVARSARRRRSPLIALGLTLTAALGVSWVASVVLKGSKTQSARARYSMIVDRPDSDVFHFRNAGQWQDENPNDRAEESSRQLARYDALDDPDWRDRDDVRWLPEPERSELEVWLLEQVLRHARALRQCSQSSDERNRALGLLDRTLSRGWSAALEAERSALLADQGLADPGRLPSGHLRVPGWMDEYLAGVAVEPLHARKALEHYLAALQAHPGLFWAQYRAAYVAGRIGEDEVAVDQYRRCVDRSPKNPALRVMLASSLCYAERKKVGTTSASPFAVALAESDRAVELDPDYAMAYRLRAWIRQASGRPEGAQADLNRLRSLTRRVGRAPTLGLEFTLKFQPSSIHATPPRTFQTFAREVLYHDPGNQAARVSLAAMIEGPTESIIELNRVLESDPGHLLARLLKAGRLAVIDPEGSIAEYSALIDDPRFEELFTENPIAFRAYHFVATDLMKRGQIAQALEVANRALVHVNRSGRLGHEAMLALGKEVPQAKAEPQGETYYLLARIHAAAAVTDRDQIRKVIENLDLAFAHAETIRTKWFPNDRRFDALRAEIGARISPDLANR